MEMISNLLKGFDLGKIGETISEFFSNLFKDPVELLKKAVCYFCPGLAMFLGLNQSSNTGGGNNNNNQEGIIPPPDAGGGTQSSQEHTPGALTARHRQVASQTNGTEDGSPRPNAPGVVGPAPQ